MILKIRFISSTEFTRPLFEVIAEHNGVRVDYHVLRNAKEILKHMAKVSSKFGITKQKGR